MLFLLTLPAVAQPTGEPFPVYYVILTFCGAGVLLTGLVVAMVNGAMRNAPYEPEV